MAMQDSISNSQVEEALAAVLSDDKFAAAPQMSAFLKYVVAQTLYEDPSRIKAYTVAVDALGKPATFDPQNDPSVRVLAKRLRGSLDTYYEKNPEIEIIIEMKAGSYVPHFVHREFSEFAKQEIPAQTPAENPSIVVTPTPGVINTVSTVEKNINLHTGGLAKTNSQVPVSSLVNPSDQSNTATTTENPVVGDVLDAKPEFATENINKQIPVPTLLHSQAPDNLTIAADTETQLREANSNDQNSDETPALNNTTLSTNGDEAPVASNHGGPGILDRVKAIPKSAIAVAVCAGLIWFGISAQFDNKENEQTHARLGAAMPLKTVNDESKIETEFRPPPEGLPIVGIDLSTDSPLGRSVVDTVSMVVSRFDHVDLHRQHDKVGGPQRWPEDYRIRLHIATASGRSDINVQLIQAESSRVAFNETLNLQSQVNSELSEADYFTVQNSAARWMQSNGPILRDYDANVQNKTEEMACYVEAFSADLHNDEVASPNHTCQSLYEENESNNQTAIVYRTWKVLTGLDNGPSEYAHITLAMAQNLVGDIVGSERSVENAMMLNPLDANILNRSALITEENGDLEKATQWRNKAAQLVVNSAVE